MRQTTLALCIVLALCAGTACAQTTGAVVEIANPIRIRMDEGAAAPIGSTVYALREAAGAGVLTGTYTVVRRSGDDVFAEPSGTSRGTAPGDRVEVAEAEASSLVRITSEPPGAAVARGGYPLGVAPLRVEVAAGEHTFVLTAPGFDPTPLTVQVPGGQILSVVQGLSRPRPATSFFVEAEIAFQAARYDAAEALLARAAENTDGTLTAAQTASLPALTFLSGIGARISSRAAARGMTPAQTADAMSKIAFVYKNRSEPAVARGVLADLDAALAGDPALAAVHALLTP